MRNLRELDEYRIDYEGEWGDAYHGAFKIPSRIDGQPMVILAAADLGWDHVSISRKNRSPNQTELDQVFRLFFKEDEAAIQFFLPRALHINVHPFCLHLWRQHENTLRFPPPEMV